MSAPRKSVYRVSYAIDFPKKGYWEFLIVHMLSKGGLGMKKTIKSKNLPPCAVRMGSLASIIAHNVTKMSSIIKQFTCHFTHLMSLRITKRQITFSPNLLVPSPVSSVIKFNQVFRQKVGCILKKSDINSTTNPSKPYS